MSFSFVLFPKNDKKYLHVDDDVVASPRKCALPSGVNNVAPTDGVVVDGPKSILQCMSAMQY